MLDLAARVPGQTPAPGGDEPLRGEVGDRAVVQGEGNADVEIAVPPVGGESLVAEVGMMEGEDLGAVEAKPAGALGFEIARQL